MTNECVRRPATDTPVSGSTDWRPCHPDGTWDPSLLFRQFTFTAEHGPHTATFLGGSASITLSPRCLKAETRLLADKTRNAPGRRRMSHASRDPAALDYLVPLGAASQSSLAQAAHLIIHQIGRCAAPWDQLPQRDNTVFIMNDAAGWGGLDDVEFRGGGSWIVAPGEAEILWCVQAWPIRTVMTQNSTVLEVINANHSLEAIMIRYPTSDICEVLDNSAAVACLKRFACDSPTLTQHMNFRRSLLTHLQGDRRIFTFWSCREEGTLADMLSKGKIQAFMRGLRQRGLAMPAQQQLARRSFQLKLPAL